MRNTRAHILTFDLPLGATGLSLLVLAFVFSRTGIPTWIPPGLMPAAGVASPLTGMTRSFVALASGHLDEAIRFHPLGPATAVACAAAALNGAIAFARGRRLEWASAALGRRWIWSAVAVAFLVVWIRQIEEVGL